MTPQKINDSAVSPVVGVMLMLVVTIIIAAVVSAFAGGLGSGTNKQPSMEIRATYSNSSGMTITHMGGDPVSTANVYFIVTPSSDFGSEQNAHWKINSSVISVNTGSGPELWSANAAQVMSGVPNVNSFHPGDVANISAADLSQVQPATYDGTTYLDSQGRYTDAFDTYFGFDVPSAIGQRFQLALVDNSGQTIATTTVTIQP